MGDLGRTGLVAIPREIRPLLACVQVKERVRWGDAILYLGQIGKRSVALAEVLVGPVHGALGAQALIALYGVNRLIGFGSAGALAPELSPGDLVIVQNAVAHDAGVFYGKRFEPSGVMGRDGQGQIGFRRTLEADPNLVALALASAQPLGGQARAGTVVTGNQAIFATARKRWLHHTFGALAVEMETAAVAQVAVAHGVPWVAVRAISDTASDDLAMDHGRLRIYLDEPQPAWKRRITRWHYLLTRPEARRRLQQLGDGLALAADRASQVVENMLRA